MSPETKAKLMFVAKVAAIAAVTFAVLNHVSKKNETVKQITGA